MPDNNSFDVIVRRKIPYITDNLLGLMEGFVIMVIITDLFFLPTRGSSLEMKTAFFIFVIPVFIKKLFMLGVVGTITTGILQALARRHRFQSFYLAMTIIKSKLPYNSLLNQADIKYDYVDSFQGAVLDVGQKLNSTEIGKAFFSSEPKWVGKLMGLRDKTVVIFGLKTSCGMVDRQNSPDNSKCEKGEQVGIFKIYERTENEIILGQDDKHLNFRVSLFLDQSANLIISTTVIFNNWFGRFYFLPVRPFHSLIVKSMLRATIRKLEKQYP